MRCIGLTRYTPRPYFRTESLSRGVSPFFFYIY
ncbi:hypothetical protein ALC56_13162 [Trachymyrmex septentrionalis]|uniref:Uncharacterized protein n=1 Tax=Trachymyrmex septentrionalis TaxID=34720 RepID=A0A195EVL7_9HYME|nr:hypothetical protein ALC56_13162 [Trachymyrmex septentrionalis]